MLHISINPSEGTPFFFQIERQLKHLIATGRLVAGDELPSVRALAQQLVLNPSTVVRAYRELESAGLIYTKRGSGTYVADRPVPYSDDERRRILCERLDAVVVEARNLGYTAEETIALLRERDQALKVERSHGDETEGENRNERS